MFELRAVERPYPGLRAFEPHEAEIFFGREAHTDRLLGILQRERFLAVIGPSGSGKSSLVRAGLLPGLAMGSLGTGSDWRIALLRPGDRPMRSLAAALLQSQVLGRHLLSHEGEPDAADIAALEAELRRGPLALATLCAEAQRRHRADAVDGTATTDFNLLVLVDQFEEIFTYADAGGQQAADESDAFVSLLLAARADAKSRPAEPGLHVALTMRTDFLGNCVRFFDLPEAINQAQYLTPRLKRDEIERAIRGPAELWGGSIEESLVAELINATGQSADQLPLVQHALARMWGEAKERSIIQPHLTWQVTETIGGVGGAIETHAKELWSALSSVEQAWAIGLFCAITERRSGELGGQDIRRPQKLKRIAIWLGCSWNDLAKVVMHFAAPDVCFLQFGEVLNGESVIDLSHEALIRQWPDLQFWMSGEYERASTYRLLQSRAKEYAAGQASPLSGADLVRAERWASFVNDRDPTDQVGDQSMTQVSAAHWAVRYLMSNDLHPIDVDRYEPHIDSFALSEAERELGQVLKFISESSNDAIRQRHLEEEHLKTQREHDFQRKLAATAQGETRRARRQSTYFAAFSAIAIFLALATGWSWQRANETALEATRLKFVADNAAEAAVKSAESAMAAKSEAEQAAHKEAVAANEAKTAQRKADAATATALGALTEATQRQMIFDAEAYFSGAKSGGDFQGVRLALAAYRIKSTADALGSLQKMAEHSTNKIVEVRSGVRAVAFSPDGLQVASASDDNAIRLWNARTGELIGNPLLGHTGSVTSIAFSNDGTRIIAGSLDSTVRIWDAKRRVLVGRVLEGHLGPVTSIAISPDGTRIASGSADKTIRLWNAKTGEAIGVRMTNPADSVTSVAFSPDGRRIASGSRSDNKLTVWDADFGASLGVSRYRRPKFIVHVDFVVVPRGGTQGIQCLAWSPDGKKVVTGNTDGTLSLWDPLTGERVGENLQLHSRTVWAVAYSPDGSQIASASGDQSIQLWDASTGERLGRPLRGHTNEVRGVAFSGNGRILVSGGADTTVRFWDLASAVSDGRPLEGHVDEVWSVAFAPDGNRIVSGSKDETLMLWDVNTGIPVGIPLRGHAGIVASVAFSPDGKHVVSGGEDKTIRLWNASTGVPFGGPIRGHSKPITSVSFSPDGRRILSASVDRTIRIWNSWRGESIGRSLVGHADEVWSAAFSPDGHRIVSGGKDKSVRLWDAGLGEAIGQPWLGHEGEVNHVEFNSDGSRVVSAGFDGVLRVWDVRSGKSMGRPLVGHTSGVMAAVFSPDAKFIASGSADNTIRIWNAQTGEPIGKPLKGNGSAVQSVAFSPDGKRIVSGGADGMLKIWLGPAGWVDKLCQILTRNFSPEEWEHFVGRAIDYSVQCPNLRIPERGEFPVQQRPAI